MILQVENLTKQFGGLTAVDNLSFYVENSEILGIIGPNGAGKSTTLNVISGFYPPTRGKIIFNNQDITKLKAHQIASLGMSRNFQASTLFMDLTVIENIFTAFHLSYKSSLWAQLLRLPAALREEETFRKQGAEILDKIGLSSVQNELTKNLPYGHQRILSVGIALATNPRLLLLDEPVTGMNQTEIMTMLDVIRAIRDGGITIIMIEHNIGAVMSLCDRIVVLNYGQKIAEGIPEEIQANEAVIEAYLGKE